MLVQILVTPSNNNTLIPIGVVGKCCIRILGVQYSDTSTATRIIVIQSTDLYFASSPQRYLTFLSQTPTTSGCNLALDISKSEYHMNNAVLTGQLLLNVIDNATGLQPANFGFCLVSLEIEKVNLDFKVDAQI